MRGHSSPLRASALLGSEPLALDLLPASLGEVEASFGEVEGQQSPFRRGSTVVAAAAALFKAVIGAGIFAFPPAVRACGLVLGSCFALTIGLISLFVTWATIEAVRELRRRGMKAASNGRIEYVEMTHIYSPRANGAITALTMWGQYSSVLG